MRVAYKTFRLKTNFNRNKIENKNEGSGLVLKHNNTMGQVCFSYHVCLVVIGQISTLPNYITLSCS